MITSLNSLSCHELPFISLLRPVAWYRRSPSDLAQHTLYGSCGSWGQKFVESKSLRVEITPEAQLCRLAGNINKYKIGLYSIGWPVCAVVSRCQDWWRTGFVVPSIEVCFCQRRCKFAWTRQCMWKRYWFTMIYRYLQCRLCDWHVKLTAFHPQQFALRNQPTWIVCTDGRSKRKVAPDRDGMRPHRESHTAALFCISLLHPQT